MLPTVGSFHASMITIECCLAKSYWTSMSPILVHFFNGKFHVIVITRIHCCSSKKLISPSLIPHVYILKLFVSNSIIWPYYLFKIKALKHVNLWINTPRLTQKMRASDVYRCVHSIYHLLFKPGHLFVSQGLHPTLSKIVAIHVHKYKKKKKKKTWR